MSAKDLIEALLSHDLSKQVVFEVEITGHLTCEVPVLGVEARNHAAKNSEPNQRTGTPRLVISGNYILVRAEVKLEVEPS